MRIVFTEPEPGNNKILIKGEAYTRMQQRMLDAVAAESKFTWKKDGPFTYGEGCRTASTWLAKLQYPEHETTKMILRLIAIFQRYGGNVVIE